MTGDAGEEQFARWIFKTNLSNSGRAETILDVLGKLNVESIGIVYEDSEFGRNAEKAVRLAQSSKEFGYYRAEQYRLHHSLSTAVESIIKDRPSVIGILSSRKDFRTVMNTIRGKNYSLNPYYPHLFSLIDLRSNCNMTNSDCINGDGFDIQDVNFVSVGTIDTDEVTKLSEVTLSEVLSVIEGLPRSEGNLEKWPEKLRNGITGIFERSIFGVKGNLPSVYKYQGDQLIDVGIEIDDFNFLERTLLLPDILYRRFGLMPLINILTIISLVVLLSSQDLRKWNDEQDLY